MLASGALDDFSGSRGDDIQAELDRMGGSADIELEIARMKAELGQGPAPKSAIESGPPQQAQQPQQQYQQQAQPYQQQPVQDDSYQQPPTQQYRQPGEGQ
nr:hypothetical protein GCM10020093_112100 [Planobispora longispora]